MDVDFAVYGAIEALELLGKVLLGCVDVRIGTLVIRKVVPNWLVSKLLPEKIRLVKEENDGRLAEPRQTEDRFKEHQSLLHLVLELQVSNKR